MESFWGCKYLYFDGESIGISAPHAELKHALIEIKQTKKNYGIEIRTLNMKMRELRADYGYSVNTLQTTSRELRKLIRGSEKLELEEKLRPIEEERQKRVSKLLHMDRLSLLVEEKLAGS